MADEAFEFERDDSGNAVPVFAIIPKKCKPGEMVSVDLHDVAGGEWKPRGKSITVQSLLFCKDGERCVINEFAFPDGKRPALCANEGF